MDEKEFLELAKKFGDEYTYGKIIDTLKKEFLDKQEVKEVIERYKYQITCRGLTIFQYDEMSNELGLE